jgi:hypothetical protein
LYKDLCKNSPNLNKSLSTKRLQPQRNQYTPTKHLKEHFTAELDEAYALDFNFKPDQGPTHENYTEVGRLLYRAKWSRDEDAARKLGECSCGSYRNIPLSSVHKLSPPRRLDRQRTSTFSCAAFLKNASGLSTLFRFSTVMENPGRSRSKGITIDFTYRSRKL